MKLRQPDSPAAQRRRAALNEILHQLAGRAHAAQLFVSFERLHELSERLLSRREGDGEPAQGSDCQALSPEVREQLVAAHTREQARLLREALELVLWQSLEGRWWTGSELTAPVFEDWAEDASCELDRALADGAPVDGELLACCFFESTQWSSARELASAAVMLEPGWRASVAELRAELSVEASDEALAALDELLQGELPLAERARLSEVLALTHERRGEWSAALRAYEHSLAAFPAPRPALAAWVLALEGGNFSGGNFSGDDFRGDSFRGDTAGACELAWRALIATWRGARPLGPAREDHLWRELLDRRALTDAPIADSTRRECEALLHASALAIGASA